jgi:glycine/D-amino acid oxidase-like deaminating enzyme
MLTGLDLPDRVDIVVVGGGFAGASTACHLAKLGVTDVLLLEASESFGAAASGQNASMIRQVATDPCTGAMLRSSVAAIKDDDWGFPVDVQWSGSLLLVHGERGIPVVEAARAAAMEGLDCAVVPPMDARKRVSILDAVRFDQAIWTPGDGIADVSALLWRYLNEARIRGVRLKTGCKVTGIEVDGGKVAAVRTTSGRTACRFVVDAAGAWAGDVAMTAGLGPLPIAAYRRHLVVTPPLPFVDPAWPLVWHLTDDWYFRPEVGGLMLSACDQDLWPAGPVPRDPAILERLAELLAARCPPLADLPVKNWWAGLRTMASDGRFVIGPYPRLQGFFWVAGLGGHGMTGSASVGRLAALLLTGGLTDPAAVKAMGPQRFLPG